MYKDQEGKKEKENTYTPLLQKQKTSTSKYG